LHKPADEPRAAGTTIVLADDHPAIRMGVRMRLEQESDLQVVAEARDGREAVHMIQSIHPDVAVLDLRMPELDGIEVTTQVVGNHTRVVLLSAASDSHLIQRALDAGASGYVDKESPIDVVVQAVHAVAAGRSFIDPSLVASLLHGGDARLSPRELEVLQLAADGMQNRAIAGELALSEETVKSHVSNVIRKLDASSRTQAVAEALRRSLIR
jgi:DNA-binding NarL/FixJ family response regulator